MPRQAQGNNRGARQTVKPRVSVQEARNFQSHRRVHWRSPQGPRTCTDAPTWESIPERAQSTSGKWRKCWKAGWKPSKQHCSLSDPYTTHSATTQQRGLPHPGKYLRFCLLQHNRCITETKKYGPNERIDQNSKKRAKRKGNTQSIRCRVQITGYKDAQGTQWGPQQHKKDPVRNKGYINLNKEHFTGKQQ